TKTTMAAVATAATASATRIGRRLGDGRTVGAPTLASRGQLAVHQVRVDRALELVGSGCERRDVVGLDLRPREVGPVEDLLAGRIEDVDVLVDAVGLVV